MAANVRCKTTNYWDDKIPMYKVRPAAQHHMKQSKHFSAGIIAGANAACSCGMSGDCQCSYSCADGPSGDD